MTDREMDQTDREIIHCLQGDARNVTTAEIGDKLDISGSTVANRISQLEESGIIAGYAPIIDYERSGYTQHHIFVGTVAGDDADEIIASIPDHSGVVNVTTLLTNQENVIIEVIAEEASEIEQVGNDLSELGVTIVRTDVVTNDVSRPFDSFGIRKDSSG